MAERKTISKKLRFEVFKRDGFTCQYCGRMAPDVVLEVDHINPVANGGENEIINLATSCFDCNRGKGKRALSEKEEVKKQQEQLKELNQKREQLEMMLEWRDELSRFETEQAEEVEARFADLTGDGFTDIGMGKVKKWIKQFGLIEVINCLEISVSQYYREGDKRSKEICFNYIPRIAANRKKEKDNPMLPKHHYIKGILRNRVNLCDERRLYSFLSQVCTDDEDYEMIKEIACYCRNWTHFWEEVNEIWEGDW